MAWTRTSRWMVGAGLVAVAALAAGVFLSGQSESDSGLVQVNGRIESDQIVVSARVPARIADVLTREGDVVQAGQVMLKLHDDGVSARTAQAQAAAEAQMAQVRALESSLTLLRSETSMLTQTAQAELTAAQAELNRLGVVAQQNALERDRVDPQAIGHRARAGARRAHFTGSPRRLAMLFSCMCEEPPTIGMHSRSRT